MTKKPSKIPRISVQSELYDTYDDGYNQAIYEYETYIKGLEDEIYTTLWNSDRFKILNEKYEVEAGVLDITCRILSKAIISKIIEEERI